MEFHLPFPIPSRDSIIGNITTFLPPSIDKLEQYIVIYNETLAYCKDNLKSARTVWYLNFYLSGPQFLFAAIVFIRSFYVFHKSQLFPMAPSILIMLGILFSATCSLEIFKMQNTIASFPYISWDTVLACRTNIFASNCLGVFPALEATKTAIYKSIYIIEWMLALLLPSFSAAQFCFAMKYWSFSIQLKQIVFR